MFPVFVGQIFRPRISFVLIAGGQQHHSSDIPVRLSIGLQCSSRIRSDRNVTTGPTSILPVPQDPIEEGELSGWVSSSINVGLSLWHLYLALTCPSDIVVVQVDTPWPLKVQDYEHGGFPSGMVCSYTIQKYLKGTPTLGGNEMSTRALHAKASLLWERATDLIRN
ncbi:uncharacterized protein BT62DRAFT_483511 [Guyanagaster necrorhizus]|uniref:Uncharacterized protein n=1 Tax=Guyanagaster necrorhizus TaxID=856835 RepID=A0A9P8AMS2_9AGAR|nr:uncharacterized protein BT62DRAFT_483511 [Guyanagaster necrorhizus MCA 3950]KAG7441543.1 hypothetical protein BT62DRAFT_483511 [Guyanagaster necrorhizus MCA 3950]